MTSVLIVDDRPDIRETFWASLEKEGHDVTTVADFSGAESALTGQPYDVVVADLKLHVNGMALLRLAREIDENIQVILVTGEAGSPSATEAVQRGAYDCVPRPLAQEELIRMVGRAAEKKRLLDEKRRLEADNRAYQADLEKVAASVAELEHRNQALTALIEIGRDISATLDSTEVLKRVTQRAAQVCEAHRCTILLLSEDGKVATPIMSQFSDGHGEWKMWRMFKDASYPVPVSQVPEAQRVIHERQPIFIPDALASSLPKPLIEPFGIRSVLLVPLVSKERVIGLMAFDRIEEGEDFTAEQVNLAMAIAAQATVAVENARLFEAERAQLLLAQTLQEVGALLTASLSLDEVCQHVFDLLSRVIKYDSVSLQLLGQDNQLSPLAARGFPDPELSSQVTHELSDHMLENFAERKVIVIPDTRNDSRWIAVPEMDYIRSWIGAPLLVKGKLIGVLNVDSTTVNAYDAALGETVMAFANQAAIAIENARLFDEEMSSRRLADTLRQVAQALNSTLSLDDVLGLILTELEHVIPLDSGSIMLLEGRELIIRAAKGFADPDGVLKVRLDLDTALLNREVVESKRPLIVGSVHKDERWIDAMKLSGLEPELHTTCSWMGIPLNVKGQVIGMLTTDKREAHFYSERDAQVALTFANQAAIAIENARLYNAAQREISERKLAEGALQERATRLELIARLGQRTTAILELDELLHQAVDLVHNAFGYHNVLTLLVEGDEIVMRAASHPAVQAMEGHVRLRVGSEGITGWVAGSGEPLLVPDVSVDSRYYAATEGIETKSELAVPIKLKGIVIGVLDVQSTELDAFSQDDVFMLQTVADQLAIAIGNARLFQDTTRRLNDLSLLHDVALIGAATLDFDQILHRTVESVRDALQLDVFGFLLIDEEAKVARLHPAFLGLPDEMSDFSVPLGEGITGWVAQTGRPLLASDVSKDPRYLDAVPNIRSEVCVPLKVGGKIIGVIDAESTQLNAFSEEHVRLFSTLAAQLGMALENARLFEETGHRLAEARLIQEVMLATASTLDFDLVLERAVKALNRALGIFHLGFLVPNERNDALVPHSFLADLEEAAFQVSIQGSLLGQAYRTGQPVLVRDMAQEPAYQETVPDICSTLAVPVRVGGRIVAVLYAQSPQAGAFDEDELRLFTTIAGQLGVTLENARLYQRLEVQAAELSQAYSELQEINRLRIELVQNVSHELRTPLGLVKGYAILLLAGDLGPILNSQRMALQVIHDRTVTLTRLIHNLTMLQALPQEALSLAPLSLVEVVRHALVEFQSLAKKTDITFLDELPNELPSVLGNQEQLGLAFGHLLDNAVKFSPDGGTVTLRAWADQNLVHVLVADEGIGISSEHLNRVFERFYQVDGSTSRRFGGMGVGLALVWEIIEAHGGTVNVESEVGEGSQFIVTLPQATGS